jgi:hypothetical protein
MAEVTQLRVLDAVETLLKTALADVEVVRNDFTLADPEAAQRIHMIDGDPGEPTEILLGGRHKSYRHEIALEITGPSVEAPGNLHALHGRIRTAVLGNRFLGGLVDFLDLTELAGALMPVSETEALFTGTASLIAEYTL